MVKTRVTRDKRDKVLLRRVGRGAYLEKGMLKIPKIRRVRSYQGD